VSRGANRHIEQEWGRNPKRIPRLVSYQTKGQLPMTLLSLIVILVAVFAAWVLSNV
jgi:hypothetical protein